MRGYQLTAIIEREDDRFVARCVELDISSRSSSGPEALSDLKETVAWFVANAKNDEILKRLTRQVEVAMFEIERG